MDEYDRGWDPQIKTYFKKILNSISFASLWMLSVATAGLFFGLAFPVQGFQWYNILFYLLSLITLGVLVAYLVRVWK